jgi:hypothetical protein
MPQSLSDEQVQQISAAVFAGRKIEAIKLYRQATRLGLKESKDFIEALEVRLRQESPGEFTAPPRAAGCSSTAAMLAVAAAAIYFVARGLLG